MEGKELISMEEMIAKLKAAVATRKDPDLVIIARTDARAVLGVDEAIRRCKAYLAAGADVLFLEAPQSLEEMQQITKDIHAPMLANMVENGKTPILPLQQLQELGFKLVIYPVVPLYAATKACIDILRGLKEQGSTKNLLDQMVDFPTFNGMIQLQEQRDLEKSFYKV